ncbi:MAG: hybrid sensor histidine kinase/response regulator [Polyangia bacterium]
MRSSRDLARLLAMLADPPSPEHFGPDVCQLVCRHLHVDAAALFIGADPPERIGSAGFNVEPPDGVPASLSAADIARLYDWAATAGYHRVELAPLTQDARPIGLAALFSISGTPIDADDLEILGVGISRALIHARAAHELTRAFEQQDREQDQLVRAERMRALGEMARGIAHDFNNALNAILGQTGVLSALVGSQPTAAEALERLRQVALAGAATIRRVQEFSGQRRDRDFARVELDRLVGHAADELRAHAPANLRVEVVADGPCAVEGNADELGELVRVLVDNAVEAMPDGGSLVLELAPAGSEITLVVADSGVGMSASVRQRALDPFFTTKGSRAKGLGLALAWGVVRRHGGLLELDSQPGRGTRVRVRLPAAPSADVEAPRPTAARPPVAAPPELSRRVLLVEDDPDNREAMASLLSLGGFEVTAADCGAAGVRAFTDGTFDVVLTDLGLPDMDGWQVAGEIKQAAPAMPIALITGWGLNLDSDEIRRRCVDLLVKKPLDPRAFIGQIEDLLQAGGRKPSA